jgi:hypothetical protein
MKPPLVFRPACCLAVNFLVFSLFLLSAGTVRGQQASIPGPTVTGGASTREAIAPKAQRTHRLLLDSPTTTIDDRGRYVIVSRVHGDIPGVLTVAVAVGPDGRVTGGEWALDNSYIWFGAIDKDGDGDRVEGLKQRGMIKGSVDGGAALLDPEGHARSLRGIRLTITGATMRYAKTTHGTGTFSVTGMTSARGAHSDATITF